MRIEAGRRWPGRLGTPSVRLFVIGVLVAVCMALLAPGTATAHVRAKYRAEYQKNLAGWQKTFDHFAHTYDQAELQSSSLATTLAPMIGDPVHREELLAGENYALQVYDRCKDLPSVWMKATTKGLNTFKAKATRYFAAQKDRRRFKKHVGRVWAEFYLLLKGAHAHVYKSFEALSHDPPALVESAQQLADGDSKAALVHEEFEKSMAALKGLR